METTEDESIDTDVVWEIGVYDAHCHPTDIMASIESIGSMKPRVLTVMSTRAQDQDLVAQAASQYALRNRVDLTEGRHVVPAFGWHPWFAYQLYDDRKGISGGSIGEHYKHVLSPSPEDLNFLESLPEPRSLSQFLAETERRLLDHPFALVGEIGLDRAARLPVFTTADLEEGKVYKHLDGDYTPGTREDRPLSPYRVTMGHQKVVLTAQLQLAAKHRRPVSVHSVQAHGMVFDILQSLWAGHEKPSKSKQKRRKSAANAQHNEDRIETQENNNLLYPPRICMHSYSGPVDPLKQFLAPTVPADVYFSFSEVINFSSASSTKAAEVIKAVPADRILVESDLHCAGERMDDLLKRIVLRICDLKGWSLRDGAQQLRSNWERFVFGS